MCQFLFRPFLKAFCLLALVAVVEWPAISQTPTEPGFIASVNAAIHSLTSGLGPPTHSVAFGANLVFANGKVVAGAPLNTLLDYVDGLKAAGAQRVDLNPGVTSISDPQVMALYDAVVHRIRQLGMGLAINPEFSPGELGINISFQDFQNVARRTYPQLAARYQPDNFVIVHEPTTAAASMGLITTPQQWHSLIQTVGPLIKAASPRTRLGAGGYQNGLLRSLSVQEDAFFRDFVAIPTLDFMTMDIYNDDTFPAYTQWIQLAKQNHKGVYIEETWAPHYLPIPLPAALFSPNGNLTESLDDVSLVGAANVDFAAMDATWLEGMAAWAAANGMEAVTAFTTETFFAYGTPGHDKIFDAGYTSLAVTAIRQGQLTATAQAFLADARQWGTLPFTSVSSASYATLSSVFTPACGTASNPCNADTTVAPDSLVSGFGADLATSSASADFPGTLGGTTVTILDSSNAGYTAPLFYVSPGQVIYYVPGQVMPGPAAVTVTSADGAVSAGIVLVAPVAPGLYAANGNGKGAAAAVAVITHADGSRTTQLTFACDAAGANCVPQPLSLAPSDTLDIELFGTGIRHAASTSAVSAQINGRSVPVQFAGPQGEMGLDQVNVRIPPGLAATGVLTVVVAVADSSANVTLSSNAVTLAVQ